MTYSDTSVCKRRIAIVCILLMLSFLLLPLLPHTHMCTGERCEVCALLHSMHELFLGAAITFFVCAIIDAPCIMRTDDPQIPTKRDCTPVGRKVKLSD